MDAQEDDILMAHNCPECDEICYCRGDRDDIVLNDEATQSQCSHHCIERQIEELDFESESDGEYY